MAMARKISIALLLCASLFAATSGFAPSNVVRQRCTALEVSTKQEHDVVSTLARSVGMIAAGSILSLSSPSFASASNSWDAQLPLSTSTVTISAQIKELDMSLPSYGEIKSTSASVENSQSLYAPEKTKSSSKGLGIKMQQGRLPPQAKEKVEKKQVKTQKSTSIPGYDF